MADPVNPPDPHRQQELYLKQMFDVKVACEYNRMYRDHLYDWVRTLGVIRAVASSGSIAAWAVWQKHPLFWATIIAITQVIDAVKDIFPVAKEHKAASNFVNEVDSIFIASRLEWESVYSASISAPEIAIRTNKLQVLLQAAIVKNFPDGRPERTGDLERARAETRVFFDETYN